MRVPITIAALDFATKEGVGILSAEEMDKFNLEGVVLQFKFNFEKLQNAKHKSLFKYEICK